MERRDILKHIAVKNKTAGEWRRLTDLFDTYRIATDKAETIKIALLKVLGGWIILDE